MERTLYENSNWTGTGNNALCNVQEWEYTWDNPVPVTPAAADPTQVPLHGVAVTCCSISSSGRYMLLGGRSGVVRVQPNQQDNTGSRCVQERSLQPQKCKLSKKQSQLSAAIKDMAMACNLFLLWPALMPLSLGRF